MSSLPSRCERCAGSPAKLGEVPFEVCALCESGTCFRWQCGLEVGQLLRILAERWALFAAVPLDAVGFKTSDGLQLDLTKSVRDSGLEGTAELVCLHAFPLDERWMETERRDGAPLPAELQVPEPPKVVPKVLQEVAKLQTRRPKANAAPAGDDEIEYSQTNRKRAGTAAWDRFESYKRAKTVNEALVFGAAPGDIIWDFKVGILTRCQPKT